MSEEVRRLEVEISGDTSPLQRALANASRSVQQFSNRTSQVTRDNNGMTDSMSRAGDAVESLSDRMRRWQAGLRNNGSVIGKFTERLGKIKDVAEDVGTSMVSLGVQSSKYIGIIAGAATAATPLVGVLGSIGASAVSATAGLAGFGAVAFSILKTMYDDQEKINKLKEKMDAETDPKKIKELQSQIKGIYETMSSEQRKAMEDMNKFTGFWGNFTSQFDKPVFQSFSNALSIAQKGLNLLKPAIDSTAQTVVQMTQKFESSLGSDRIKSLFAWFGDTAGSSLMAFGKSIGYTLEGVLQFFKAFNPLMSSTEGGLVRMTKAFADWSANLSNNNGFKAFLDYTKANALLLGSIFKNAMGIIGQSIKLVSVVAAPAIHGILELVNKFLAWRNSIKVSESTISSFKEKAIAGFQALRTFVQPAIQAVSSFVGAKIKEIRKFWDTDGAQFVQAVKNAFSIIAAIVKFVMPVVLAIIKSVWGNIQGVISGAIKVIIGVIRVFTGIFTGNFKTAWQGVVGIFKGGIQLAWNAVQLLFIGRILKGIGGFIKAFGASLKGGWTNALNGLKGFVSNSTNFFKSFYTKGKKWFDDLVDAARNLPKKLGDGMAKMKDKASAGIKKLANHMVGMLATGVNGAINGVNWVLKRIGVDEKNQLDTWEPPHYKNGTGGHPEDGFAVVGDGKKEELMQDPNGKYYMSPATDTLVWMKKGTRVWSGEQTEQIMKSATKYDSGNSTLSDFVKSAGNKIANGASAVKDKVVDTAVSVKDKAVSGAKAMSEKVSDIWSYASDPSKLMKLAYEKFIPKLPNVAGGFGKIGTALVKKAKDQLVTYISEKMSEFMPSFDDGGSFTGLGGYYLGSPFRITTRFTPNGNKADKVHSGGKHNGLDLAAPAGTIIKSLTSGIVKEVLVNNATGGNLARIQSGNDLLSYAHMLRAPFVKVGDRVKEGQKIGLVGSTGFSTGNHLDLKIKRNGKYIDPLAYLKGMAGGGGVSGGSWNGQYKDIIKAKAAKYGVSPALIAGIIQQESQWNPNARSPVGATGLMQLMPATARSMGVKNPRNPEQNIDGGTKYIKQMLKYNKGNVPLALASYNAGYGNVLKYHGIPPFKETQNYVRKVTANIRKFGGQFFSGGVAENPQIATLAENGYKEFIIPTEPKYRNRAKSLIFQAMDAIGMGSPLNTRVSKAPTNQSYTTNAQSSNSNDKEIIKELRKQNSLLTQLVAKDTTFVGIVDGKVLVEYVDNHQTESIKSKERMWG